MDASRTGYWVDAGVVDEYGNVMMWGGGRFWQLGTGVSQDATSPQEVPAPTRLPLAVGYAQALRPRP